MKKLLLGDLHFGARNFNQTIAAWQEKFFAECFFPTLLKLNCPVIQMGDIFDDHTGPTSAVLDFAYRVFFDPMHRTGIPFTAILGNHDCYYRDTLECNSLKRIAGVQVISEPTVMNNCLLVPWIVKKDRHKLDKFFDDSDIKFTLGHLELNGGMLYPGRVWTDGDDPSQFPGKIFSGHFHSPSENYVGTPYDLTWAEYRDKKRMVLIDTATGTWQDIDCLPENLHVEVDAIDGKDYTGRIVRVKSESMLEQVKGADEIVCYESEDEVEDVAMLDIDVKSAFYSVLGEGTAMQIVEEILR